MSHGCPSACWWFVSIYLSKNQLPHSCSSVHPPASLARPFAVRSARAFAVRSRSPHGTAVDRAPCLNAQPSLSLLILALWPPRTRDRASLPGATPPSKGRPSSMCQSPWIPSTTLPTRHSVVRSASIQPPPLACTHRDSHARPAGRGITHARPARRPAKATPSLSKTVWPAARHCLPQLRPPLPPPRPAPPLLLELPPRPSVGAGQPRARIASRRPRRVHL